MLKELKDTWYGQCIEFKGDWKEIRQRGAKKYHIHIKDTPDGENALRREKTRGSQETFPIIQVREITVAQFWKVTVGWMETDGFHTNLRGGRTEQTW